MLRVGLTGGIATGKSHVLSRLADRGFHTLDLDDVARDLVAPGAPALAEIVHAFGREVLDEHGTLDRSALASRVFERSGELQRLNGILHPRVRALEARWAASLAGEPSAVLVTDGALLVEAGAHLRFDRLVVVHCEPGRQLARLRHRDGLDERSAQARIEAQMPIGEKREFAHYQIDTNGSFEDTERAVDRLASELRLRLSDRPRSRPPLEPVVGGLVHGPTRGPRGLSPERLLRTIADSGGLEMEALSARLTPRPATAWYRAALTAEPDAPATALSIAIAAWALLRPSPDPERLVAAAASLARLTHKDRSQVADACLLSLAALEIGCQGSVSGGIEAAVRHRSRAESWGGAPVSDKLDRVFEAALRHPGDPEAARGDSASRDEAPGLAGGLVGLAVGAGTADWPALAALLAALGHEADSPPPG